MLQLNSSMFEVDGVTVCADHADPDQFWYLAKRVALDKRPDGSDAISLLKWKPAAVEAGVKGGGFLMFQTVVVLPEETRNRIMGRISALSPRGTPRLAPAPIETGTVRCLALNLEGGGTVAVEPPPGAFNAVTKILGATKPSITGEQTAAFSLVLDQEGATILQKAFESGTTPVGVIYELNYSGLTPDLHVTIKADFERIYTHFSASVDAQIYPGCAAASTPASRSWCRTARSRSRSSTTRARPTAKRRRNGRSTSSRTTCSRSGSSRRSTSAS